MPAVGTEKTAPIVTLALDTSSRASSIAVASGDQIVKFVINDADGGRSERLWGEIESVLDETGLTLGDVSLYAVCTGPGGFTGIRVGVAAVKGLAMATRSRVVGVTALEALAYGARPGEIVCSLIRGHHGDVYSQVFTIEDDGAPAVLLPPIVSPLADAINRVTDRDAVLFVGEHATMNAEAIGQAAGRRYREADSLRLKGWRVKPEPGALAEGIARLAFLRHLRGETGWAESLAACYVRPAEAEIKLGLGLVGSKINRMLKTK
ncbi:MAG TPA: tRNA (adenosine(37)-N6)-threonylcarbamoyltransferase complex dimerization subunit type 1 TsaB [Blastocatellia bacterium]|nr:tRNA (adenosine(37)-N6)-threonylcarbamoyltransferase complex dimerization subunit type 1 TsaB [Blastocatellia bacterium]